MFNIVFFQKQIDSLKNESEDFSEETLTENVPELFEEIEETKKTFRPKKKVKLKVKTKNKIKTEVEKCFTEGNVCLKCGKSFSLVVPFLEHSQKCQNDDCLEQAETICDRFFFFEMMKFKFWYQFC